VDSAREISTHMDLLPVNGETPIRPVSHFSLSDNDIDYEETNLIIYRCLKTACHELCHVFGLTHCPYYECVMNGSNLLEEADRKPFLLCAICLRKTAVYHNFEDKIAQRYEGIL
jgi:archaemetzincin